MSNKKKESGNMEMSNKLLSLYLISFTQQWPVGFF